MPAALPRRRHPVWSVGVAVVALLLLGLAPSVHAVSWHSPPTARAVSVAGHAAAPAAARPASGHLGAATPAPQHLDLAATPVAELSLTRVDGWVSVADAPTAFRHVTAVLPHGRGPPAP